MSGYKGTGLGGWGLGVTKRVSREIFVVTRFCVSISIVVP